MKIKNVSFQYQNHILFDNFNLEIPKGKITTIIGPNGSGKSTLLMLLARIHQPTQGHIFYDNQDIYQMKAKDFAKEVAVVHQKNDIYQGLSVKTIVGYGRLPYLKYYQSFSKEDLEIIEWALEVTHLKEFENHMLDTLSGGQQQRVWLAMALAQKSSVLLLDEPTTYLDIKHQIDILNLIQSIHLSYQMTIVMVHHDINQAIHYSDYIMALKDGQILFQGESQDVVISEGLFELFDFHFDMIESENEKIILNYNREKILPFYK